MSKIKEVGILGVKVNLGTIILPKRFYDHYRKLGWSHNRIKKQLIIVLKVELARRERITKLLRDKR